MKIGILYFSGTGNTACIAKSIANVLQQNSHTVKLQTLEDGWFEDKDFDFFIFGTPKYFEYVPLFFTNWINKNIGKLTKSTPAAIFITGGADMHTGFKGAMNILSHKNIEIVCSKTIKMASNYTLASNKPIDEETAKRSCDLGEKTAEEFALNISKGDFSLEKANFLMEILCKNVSYVFGKKTGQNGKHFSVSVDCVQCKKCIKNCPTKNISLIENTITFSDKCILCTRCLNSCPKNAIYYKGTKVYQYKLKLKTLP